MTTCTTAFRVLEPCHHFTGKERDAESGNDYFGARYYGSNLGRFVSPDDGSDQSPDDPQSWNLYSYVRNNPLINTDPDGHGCQKTTITNTYTDSTGTHTTTSTQTDYSTCPVIILFGTVAHGTINTLTAASNAAQNLSNALSQIDWQKGACVGKLAMAGMAAGAGVGALAGAPTGPGEVATVPLGAGRRNYGSRWPRHRWGRCGSCNLQGRQWRRRWI
jgi:RHS repeat-associated protein